MPTSVRIHQFATEEHYFGLPYGVLEVYDLT